MSRKTENTGFICVQCGKPVPALTNGGYRNHCPFCLYSLHVDIHPGDRKSKCLGQMKPAGIAYNGKKGFQIIHMCLKCGATRTNKVAENTDLPDDIEAIINLTGEC